MVAVLMAIERSDRERQVMRDPSTGACLTGSLLSVAGARLRGGDIGLAEVAGVGGRRALAQMVRHLVENRHELPAIGRALSDPARHDDLAARIDGGLRGVVLQSGVMDLTEQVYEAAGMSPGDRTLRGKVTRLFFGLQAHLSRG